MPVAKTTREIFLKEYSAALAQDTAAMFVGAGVSIAAGYPSWKTLLRDIGAELGVDSNDISVRSGPEERLEAGVTDGLLRIVASGEREDWAT
jgi:hypothetical protein